VRQALNVENVQWRSLCLTMGIKTIHRWKNRLGVQNSTRVNYTKPGARLVIARVDGEKQCARWMD
jgi:hypothetical protein